MQYIASLTLLMLPAVMLAQGAGPRVSPYLTLDYSVGEVRSEAAYVAGAELGAILKQRFTVGLAGYGLANKEAMVPAPGAPAVEPLGFGYGGLRVGYLFGATNASLRPVADLLLGAGQIRARESERDDRVVVVESSVAMEANLAHFLRGALGVTYRFLSGSDLAGVSDQSLSGFAGRVTLRFGWF